MISILTNSKTTLQDFESPQDLYSFMLKTRTNFLRCKSRAIAASRHCNLIDLSVAVYRVDELFNTRLFPICRTKKAELSTYVLLASRTKPDHHARYLINTAHADAIIATSKHAVTIVTHRLGSRRVKAWSAGSIPQVTMFLSTHTL